MKRLRELLLGTILLVLVPSADARLTDEAGHWVEVRSAHFVVASNASEGEARGVAEDFEQIRSLFHSTFPELRVDPAQPIVIVAARDEATMKMLAPEEWVERGTFVRRGCFTAMATRITWFCDWTRRARPRTTPSITNIHMRCCT